MTGMPDHMLRGEVKSAAAFERIQRDILSVLPGVQCISFTVKTVL